MNYTNLFADPNTTDVFSSWKYVALLLDRHGCVYLLTGTSLLSNCDVNRCHANASRTCRLCRALYIRGMTKRALMGMRGVLASIHLTASEVKWFGGKRLEDDGYPRKETV
jgi:hypothetical protein